MENHLSLFSSIGLLTEAPLWNEGRLREKRCPTAGILSGCYSLGIFLKSQAAKARGSACLSFHWKAKYFCLLSAEQRSTCCVPAALEARRQKNWPCNFCLISLLLREVLCFGEMCADRPSLNSCGLVVQHAAAVTGCWIALAEFGFLAAGRVNAVYGRRKEDLYFRAASAGG